MIQMILLPIFTNIIQIIRTEKKKKKNKLDDFISSVQQPRYTYNLSSIKRRQIED